jgi:hypothetical protein
MKRLLFALSLTVLVGIGPATHFDCMANCQYEATQLKTICMQSGGSEATCSNLAWLNLCACASQECSVQLPSCPSQ